MGCLQDAAVRVGGDKRIPGRIVFTIGLFFECEPFFKHCGEDIYPIDGRSATGSPIVTRVIADSVYGSYRPALKRRAAKRRPVNGAFSSFSRFQPALLRSRGVYASAKLSKAFKLREYAIALSIVTANRATGAI